MVVPVSIRIPKAMELKLQSLLVKEGGTGYRANSALTKALETALGCSIKNFNFFLPENGEQENKYQPLASSKFEQGEQALFKLLKLEVSSFATKPIFTCQ